MRSNTLWEMKMTHEGPRQGTRCKGALRPYIKEKEDEELQGILPRITLQKSCVGSNLVGSGKGSKRDSAEEVDKEGFLVVVVFQNLGQFHIKMKPNLPKLLGESKNWFMKHRKTVSETKCEIDIY
ncbi:unnamed protein product [Caretta caretta]